jgi:predicted carbohydrate-binding protein with CBM5 and CBM33 domain
MAVVERLVILATGAAVGRSIRMDQLDQAGAVEVVVEETPLAATPLAEAVEGALASWAKAAAAQGVDAQALSDWAARAVLAGTMAQIKSSCQWGIR